MALSRVANKAELIGEGEKSFYVITNKVVFLEWQNSLNEWVVMKEFRVNQPIVVALESEVKWRFKYFDSNSYVETA